MTLTVLSDDAQHPSNPDLSSKHGFSLHIQTEQESILYDFGPKGVLENNARKLGIRLSGVTTAVLSHGHYDHAGDLEAFLKSNDIATVYHGRGAFFPRWSISGGSPRDVGMPLIPTDEVVSRLSVVDFVEDLEEITVLPAAPGPGPRPVGNAKLLCGDEGARLPDEFTDELSLILRTDEGLVLVTGCAHRGILNIMEQAITYCRECPIRAIIGGFHLTEDETKKNLENIAETFASKLPETRIIAGHCTGESAKRILSERLGEAFEPLHVGKVLTF